MFTYDLEKPTVRVRPPVWSTRNILNLCINVISIKYRFFRLLKVMSSLRKRIETFFRAWVQRSQTVDVINAVYGLKSVTELGAESHFSFVKSAECPVKMEKWFLRWKMTDFLDLKLSPYIHFYFKIQMTFQKY